MCCRLIATLLSKGLVEAHTKTCEISGSADTFAAVYVDEVQKGIRETLATAVTQDCTREPPKMETP